jgi:hypothetical protein
VLSPALVRQHFSRQGTPHPSLQQQLGSGQVPAAVLLEYCLADIMAAIAAGSKQAEARQLQQQHSGRLSRLSSSGRSVTPEVESALLAQQQLHQLHQLPLLPLADGGTGTLEVGRRTCPLCPLHLSAGSISPLAHRVECQARPALL